MRRPPHSLADDTRLVLAGRNTEEQHGFVNPPVYHGSTVLYPDAASLKAHKARYTYGRRGSPTTDALQDALSELDGVRIEHRGTVIDRRIDEAVMLFRVAAGHDETRVVGEGFGRASHASSSSATGWRCHWAALPLGGVAAVRRCRGPRLDLVLRVPSG